jgi:hypothetical protein
MKKYYAKASNTCVFHDSRLRLAVKAFIGLSLLFCP